MVKVGHEKCKKKTPSGYKNIARSPENGQKCNVSTALFYLFLFICININIFFPVDGMIHFTFAMTSFYKVSLVMWHQVLIFETFPNCFFLLIRSSSSFSIVSHRPKTSVFWHKITVMPKNPTGSVKIIPKTKFFSPIYTLLKWRIQIFLQKWAIIVSF